LEIERRNKWCKFGDEPATQKQDSNQLRLADGLMQNRLADTPGKSHRDSGSNSGNIPEDISNRRIPGR
jgi:hypothetical protein